MASPVWNKDRKMWVIQGKKNGLRKSFYSSVSGLKGKKEVIAKYNDWLDFGGIDKITVSKCVELYLEDIEKRLGKKDTYRTAEQYCRLYIVPTLGKAKMSNLSLRDWQAILNNARPVSERVKVLSRKTLLNLRGVIVGLHRFAYVNYYCEDWRGTLYIPQGYKVKGKDILQPDEIARLFEPSDLFYYPAFLIMLLCGLRPGEALGIKPSDIKGSTLTINRSVSDKSGITQGKNKNARRVVPLPPLAEQIINETIERNASCGFDNEWVFCSGSGTMPSQNTMRKHWNKLKEERNLSGTPYSLRHTFVSIVSSQTHLAEGTLKSLIGHSESMDTYGTYKHTVSGELEDAAKVINLTFERLRAENT